MSEQQITAIPTRGVHSPGNGWRVGNVGLLLIQAAKQGSRDSLEFLFGSVPQGMSIASLASCSCMRAIFSMLGRRYLISSSW